LIGRGSELDGLPGKAEPADVVRLLMSFICLKRVSYRILAMSFRPGFKVYLFRLEKNPQANFLRELTIFDLAYLRYQNYAYLFEIKIN